MGRIPCKRVYGMCAGAGISIWTQQSLGAASDFKSRCSLTALLNIWCIVTTTSWPGEVTDGRSGVPHQPGGLELV